MTTSVIKKNGIVIDSSTYVDNYHVLKDDDNIYTCTLNQTNIKTNNNKFYIMQLLKHDTNDEYILYTRYGRIGDKGVSNGKIQSNKSTGIKQFEKTFKSKTGNLWLNRDDFVKKTGKYFMSQIDYGDDSDESEDDDSRNNEADDNKTSDDKNKKEKIETKELKCSLDKAVRLFIELIGNVKMMNSTMKTFNIDIKKMPLGKISKKQLKDSYKVLEELLDELKANPQLLESDKIIDLTSMFYTLIPSSFGRKKPPLINTENQIKNYLEMLDVLSNLAIASTIISNSNNKKNVAIHPADRIYKQLNIDLSPLSLSKDTDTYRMIETYMKNTVAPTHNRYNLELLDVLLVNRQVENDRFTDHGNIRLLFHGSRVANFMGILSQGLMIFNKAVKTGYMFGPGLYFSNCATKSANYCFTNRTNNTAVMLLCEVSLGNIYECEYSEYITWLPNKKYQSTWGQGGSTTDPKDTFKYNDPEIGNKEVMVPYGKLSRSNRRTGLLYDEFIVYDESQVKIKYALKIKFNYR